MGRFLRLRKNRVGIAWASMLIAVAPALAETSASAPSDARMDPAHKALGQSLVDKGMEYLLSRRDDDGGWSLQGGTQKPAMTAMVVKALIQHPRFGAASPDVERGMQVMLRYRQPDGGVYDPRIGYANYNSSLVLMALASAEDPRQEGSVRKLVEYLKGKQIMEGSETPRGEEIGPDHAWIGGTSYGQHGRPDGSNAGMWAQALHDAGVPAEDPAMQRMLGFFSRLQNRSESNPAQWAVVGINDGGFVYACGESKAGPGPGGQGLRSYGSLTYVGFKSMLHAGLTREDPRVAAAYDWIRAHWTLESNPNMPGKQSSQGLYYYYHAYAKALRAWGEPVIRDTRGVAHNWRHELIDALARRMREDGSWTNDADRWHEGSPVLVTAYAVLALQEALRD
jgi:squalene-hopene/tetraprenyl-beta-curcumene cyclase